MLLLLLLGLPLVVIVRLVVPIRHIDRHVVASSSAGSAVRPERHVVELVLNLVPRVALLVVSVRRRRARIVIVRRRLRLVLLWCRLRRSR